MASKKYYHTHKLLMRKYPSGYCVYFCVDNCSFVIQRALALGKENICWVCGDKFTLQVGDLKTVRPRCDECKKKRGLRFVNEIARGNRKEKVETQLSNSPRTVDENTLEEMLRKISFAPVEHVAVIELGTSESNTMSDDDEL